MRCSAGRRQKGEEEESEKEKKGAVGGQPTVAARRRSSAFACAARAGCSRCAAGSPPRGAARATPRPWPRAPWAASEEEREEGEWERGPAFEEKQVQRERSRAAQCPCSVLARATAVVRLCRCCCGAPRLVDPAGGQLPFCCVALLSPTRGGPLLHFFAFWTCVSR